MHGRPAYICTQIVRTGQKQSLKQEILEKCDDRNDKWASQVRVRVCGVVSDLHAAITRAVVHYLCLQDPEVALTGG